MKILVVNAGSSSLKYQLIDMDGEKELAKGLVERIGIAGSRLKHSAGEKKTEIAQDIPDHEAAAQLMLQILQDPEYGVIRSTDEIGAVGHRVLHGGNAFTASVIVNDAAKKAIRDCFPLGPLHNPANLMGIEACEKVMKGTPQVAVFDTAFHQTMPPKAYMYGVPKMYETHLIVDGAKLFDVDELLSLNSYAQQMSEKYQCDFVMVFIDGLGNYTDIGDYTEDYYSFNEYGYNDTEDGIIFVWDTSDGNCQIYVSGAPFDKDIIAGEEKFNQIFDYVFGAPDYYYCAKAYIDICAKLYEDARLYAKVPADHYVICCPADSSYADYFNALLYKAYSS